jgi:hypothetical protein
MPDEKTPAEKTAAEIELEDSIRSIRGVGENAAGTDTGDTDAGETDAGASADDTGSVSDDSKPR